MLEKFFPQMLEECLGFDISKKKLSKFINLTYDFKQL